MKLNVPESKQPRIVIIGAGFAGLKLARKLNSNQYQIVLIDKNNYHQFQPLFYQVATSGLEASSISFPLRKVFQQHHKNIHVRITTLTEIKPQEKFIQTTNGKLRYDYLVLGMGLDTNYFGLENVMKYAFPMKTVTEAVLVRNAILENYENALTIENAEDQKWMMSIAIIGGGATGVELAGSLAELKRHILPNDYPELDFNLAKVYLVESSPSILRTFSDKSIDSATKYLRSLGIELMLNTTVKDYDGKTLYFTNGKSICVSTMIWAAGVKAFPIEGLNSDVYGAGGRFIVDRYNKVVGYDNIFALGDMALMITEKYHSGHPLVAQVALQQAKHLARNFKGLTKGKLFTEFEYRDAGSMATIGRNKAVVQLPFISFQGFFAWMVWCFIHLMSIVGVKNRLQIFINWFWSYITFDKSFRLIYKFKSKDRN